MDVITGKFQRVESQRSICGRWCGEPRDTRTQSVRVCGEGCVGVEKGVWGEGGCRGLWRNL